MARGLSRDATSLRKELSAGKVAPVYFLHGEEAFLKEQAVAALRTSVIGEAGSEGSLWSLTVLEAGSTALAEILDAARTLPMLSARRLVLVKNAENIRESDAEPLKEYLQDPSPTTCLVFTTGSGKADFRKAVFRALQTLAAVVEFPVPKGPSIAKWIRDRVRERDAEIDPEAVALLEAHRGADLFAMDQEISKVLDFLAPSRRITAEALGETLGTAVAGSIFEMAERVGSGEKAEAIRLLRGILAEGEEPVRLLFLIARHLRILVTGKALVRQGHRGRELASALGIPPYPMLVEKTQRLIDRFPEEAGAPSLRRILEADRALKGGGGKGAAVLERLVLDIASLVSRGRPRAGARA